MKTAAVFLLAAYALSWAALSPHYACSASGAGRTTHCHQEARK